MRWISPPHFPHSNFSVANIHFPHSIFHKAYGIKEVTLANAYQKGVTSSLGSIFLQNLCTQFNLRRYQFLTACISGIFFCRPLIYEWGSRISYSLRKFGKICGFLFVKLHYDPIVRLVGHYYRGHVVEKVIGNMTRPASWLSKLFTSNTVNRVRVLINGETNQLIISRCCSCAGLWICCRFCLCSSCSAEGGSLEESDLEGGSREVTT